MLSNQVGAPLSLLHVAGNVLLNPWFSKKYATGSIRQYQFLPDGISPRPKGTNAEE
jgi:hypothetical protein